MNRRTCNAIAIAALSPMCLIGTTLEITDKNFLASIDAELAAIELVAAAYGADPAMPDITTTSTFSTAGFSSSTTGVYFGNPLQLLISGTYNPSSDSTVWTGGGTFQQGTWSIAGEIRWQPFDGSETPFLIRIDESISGLGGPVRMTNIDAFGNPTFDTGTATRDVVSVASDGTGPRLKTTHISGYEFNFLFIHIGAIPDDTVAEAGPGGTITKETRMEGGSIEGGPKLLKGGGTVTGGTSVDKITISDVPEPSTLLLLGCGFFAFALSRLCCRSEGHKGVKLDR